MENTSFSRIFHEFFRREPVFASTALFLLLLIIPTTGAMLLDLRTVLDQNVWVKPLKFEVALAVYMATLAWFAGWLPQGMTRSIWYRIYSRVVAIGVLGEIACIAGSSFAGVGSHFNFATSISSLVYALMGVLALILTSAALVYAIAIAFNRSSTLPAPFRLSVVLGLFVTAVTTVWVAGFMSSQSGHAVVSAEAISNPGSLPLLGWLRGAGDLRVAHFFATHALHFIPLVGWFAAKLSSKPMAKGAVIGFTLGYTAFIAFVFLQALDGLPFVA